MKQKINKQRPGPFGLPYRGNCTDHEEIIRGVGGSVDLDKAFKVHKKHAAFAGSVVWHSGVHSHNLKEVPRNNPRDEFSPGDRRWARKHRIALILVADSGSVRKFKHSIDGPENGVEIGKVCGCGENTP